MVENIGLVLEGGGMRGLYTAGILDFFIDKGLYFKNCIGVSAGACHACSYYCRQRERALRVSVDYLDDKNYCGAYSLIKTGDFFGVEMIYGTIPNKLYPLDNKCYKENLPNFYAVVTDCATGIGEYIKINDVYKDLTAIRASASLPLLSHKVAINDKYYLDGGVADSIPIKAMENMGITKNVVILTQPIDYRKKANSLYPVMKIKYRKNKGLLNSIKNRHINYNNTIDYIARAEKDGNVFVIRPKADLGIGRVEKNRDKLMNVYKIGYKDAENSWQQLSAFINN